jgi:hypothetical protein
MCGLFSPLFFGWVGQLRTLSFSVGGGYFIAELWFPFGVGGICFCCCQGVSLLRTHLRAKNFGGDTRCTKCKERVFGGEDHKKYRSVCILLRYTNGTGIVLSLSILITSMLELSGTNIRTGSYMEHGTIL